MKRMLFALICIAFAGTVLAQEKYPAPTPPNPDQKFNSMLYQYWALTAAAINLAKANGISPFEYGKSVGKLFAPTWGLTDFDKMVKGMMNNFEMMRRKNDSQPVAKENNDGSVSIIADDHTIHDYFTRKPFNITYDEFLQYFSGIFQYIAKDRIQGKTSFDHQDSLLIFTVKRQ